MFKITIKLQGNTKKMTHGKTRAHLKILVACKESHNVCFNMKALKMFVVRCIYVLKEKPVPVTKFGLHPEKIIPVFGGIQMVTYIIKF